MEQEVKDNDVLLLRFKYHSFFDLNPKVRHGEDALMMKTLMIMLFFSSQIYGSNIDALNYGGPVVAKHTGRT